jgi:hypothetical protein
MPKFQPGQSGNPNGVRNFWSFRNALNRAIAQSDGKLLRDAAEALLASAAQGEPWAIKELADRLDGKPKESLVIDASDKQAKDLTDAELLTIAAGRSRRAAEQAAGESGADPIH